MHTNASGRIFCAASWYSTNSSPGICRISIGPSRSRAIVIVRPSVTRRAQAMLRAARSRGIQLLLRRCATVATCSCSSYHSPSGSFTSRVAQSNVSSLTSTFLVSSQARFIPSANRPARIGRFSCEPSLYLPATDVAARAVEVNMQPGLLGRLGLIAPHADEIRAALARVIVTLRMRRIVSQHRQRSIIAPETEHPHVGIDRCLPAVRESSDPCSPSSERTSPCHPAPKFADSRRPSRRCPLP